PPPAPSRDGGLDGRLGDRAPHGDGFARRAARFAAHLVTTTRATRELAELADAAQAPVTTGRRIAVVSVRGGAGRTTVTALLGSVFATRRADHVLLADADPDHGSLAWRLGLAEREGLASLGPRLLGARGVADLDPLLPRAASGLRLLPGPAGAPPGATRDVTRALSRFFAVCVTDCGRGLAQPGTADVLHDAHAAVVVAPATPDGVRSTLAGLAQVPPALLQRTVIALNTTGRGGRAALHVDAAREVLTRTGAALVAIPYDRHLAAATPVEPGRLAEATAIEATRLAGLALHRAGQPPWAPGPR
ncbi:MinD/ParA family ATP-binding protein, partial [Pseudonocardia lacus]|uniref:MinD/ParA family ATP-binding protein n=1 Tax=Pseudonocardia lacus TaxID=2835865 RepID=UPI0027E27D6C